VIYAHLQKARERCTAGQQCLVHVAQTRVVIAFMIAQLTVRISQIFPGVLPKGDADFAEMPAPLACVALD
jgi:hypothetical protein